jgi:hypothetical protein
MGLNHFYGISVLSDHQVEFQYHIDDRDTSKSSKFNLKPRVDTMNGITRSSNRNDIINLTNNYAELSSSTWGFNTPLTPATPYDMEWEWYLTTQTPPITGDVGFWTYGWLFKSTNISSVTYDSFNVSCQTFKTGGDYSYEVPGIGNYPIINHGSAEYKPVEIGYIYSTSPINLPSIGDEITGVSKKIIATGSDSLLNSFQSADWFSLLEMQVEIEGLSADTYYVRPYIEYKSQYKNPSYEWEYRENQFAYGNQESVVIEEEPPNTLGIPQNFTATGNNSSQVIDLDWDAVSEATSYLIERRTLGGVWGGIGSTPNTYLTNSMVDPGVTYEYRVRAFRSSDGTYSSYSNTDTAMIESLIVAPTAPSLSASSGYVGYIEVEWNSDPNVDYYDLYRGTTKIASGLIGNSYTDNIIGGHFYYVKAFNSAGSTNSNTDNGFAYSLPAPTSINASDDEIGFIDIIWSPVTGAEEYKLSRDGNIISTIDASSGTSYIDTIAPGTYNYQVSAYKLSIGGKPSTIDEGTSRDLSTPPMPELPYVSYRSDTELTFVCDTPNALISVDNNTFLVSSPLELEYLTPNTGYYAYAYVPAVPGQSTKSPNTPTIIGRTKRSAPEIPVATEITKDSMRITSSSTGPGLKITLSPVGGGSAMVQDNGTVFTGLENDTEYIFFAQYIQVMEDQESDQSDTNNATTEKNRFGKPTEIEAQQLSHRTVRLVSLPTEPEGSPVLISCNGITKESGSLWTWLDPDTVYDIEAWIEPDGEILGSEIRTGSFRTFVSPIEPDLNLMGIMNDGSRAPQSLLEENLIITSSNPDVVEIVDNQILVVGTGTTRITFEVNGKTTFTDLNIV